MSSVAAVAGSVDYQDLMRNFRDQSGGSQLVRPWEFCRLNLPSEVNEGYMDIIYRRYHSMVTTMCSKIWSSPASPDSLAQETEDPETLVLYESIESLLSLNNESYRISLGHIGLVIPEWLIEAQASKVRDAVTLAGKTIGTLEYAPAAAFAAYGYQLCPFDSDWMPCPAPGRIMTLDFTRDSLAATLIPTPHLLWLEPTMRFKMNETLGLEKSVEKFSDEDEVAEAMAEWIDKFVESRKPDKAILVGRLTNHSVFKKAISISKVSSLLVPNPKQINPGNAIALGAAKIIKDRMESQGEDCSEDQECERVREKADQLAGPAALINQEHSHNRVEL